MVVPCKRAGPVWQCGVSTLSLRVVVGCGWVESPPGGVEAQLESVIGTTPIQKAPMAFDSPPTGRSNRPLAIPYSIGDRVTM